MKEQTSTSKILDSMDEGTKYSTPIFGSEASDVAMPRLKMNAQPVARTTSAAAESLK